MKAIYFSLALGVATAAFACGDDETATTTSTGGATSTSTTSTGGAASTTGNASGGAGGSATGGASSQGGSATGGGASGATKACQDCVAMVYSNDMACAMAIQACDADVACNNWKTCSSACFDTNDTVACYKQCDNDFPHDTGLSTPLAKCTCDACSAECVASCS